jgi:hypothetical protein
MATYDFSSKSEAVEGIVSNEIDTPIALTSGSLRKEKSASKVDTERPHGACIEALARPFHRLQR